MAGAAEPVLSLGGEFVDDLESADGGEEVSFEEAAPDAGSDDGFESDALEAVSFESAPFSPARA
jgi:hypothetical protein